MCLGLHVSHPGVIMGLTCIDLYLLVPTHAYFCMHTFVGIRAGLINDILLQCMQCTLLITLIQGSSLLSLPLTIVLCVLKETLCTRVNPLLGDLSIGISPKGCLFGAKATSC